ncbi:fibronectin type III domain-containing protein [Bacillus mycoides]|uniref:fibronectin type III domain-containing protein n=1 Tax=Bacillus mycoides TaxID=1405 RepID=UPI003D02353E
MKLKKCGFLFSLVMIVCFALPSFASAKEINFLSGKQFYKKSFNPEYTFVKGNEDSYSYLFEREVIADLGKELSVSRYYYSAQGGVQFGYIAFYDSNFRLIRQEKFDGPSNSVSVEGVRARYVSVGNTGRDSTRISSVYVYGDDGLISDVSNLKANPEMKKVTLAWKNPVGEPNFTGVKIYQDSKNIATLDKNTVSYVVEGLKESESYVFTVKSLDQNKAETKGTSVNTATLMPVIKPPENVFLTPQDKKIVIAWDDVKSPHLQGYNVYVDGKKVNDKPLNSSKLVVNNLENNKSYKVQISAVNKNNIEGEKSKEKTDKPSSDALEVEYDVKIPFSPLDLLTSSVSLLAILGGFVLLSIAIIWFKPLKELIVKAVRREKDKK